MARRHHYIDPDEFAEVIFNYFSGVYKTQEEAARNAKMSIPTFKKYLYKFLKQEPLPDNCLKE